jgi:hypothetical protein
MGKTLIVILLVSILLSLCFVTAYSYQGPVRPSDNVQTFRTTGISTGYNSCLGFIPFSKLIIHSIKLNNKIIDYR